MSNLEGSYIFPATDNIDITSGILVIINPEHNSSNDTIYSGSQKSEVCPMPYALCPMPYALCPVVPHLSEKGYMSEQSRPNLVFELVIGH